MSRYEKNEKNRPSLIVIAILVVILMTLAFWLYKSTQSDNGSDHRPIDLPQEKKVVDIEFDDGSENRVELNKPAIVHLSPETSLIENSKEGFKIKVKQLPSLANSDSNIRGAVQGVSEKLEYWFQFKQTIRKYIIIINDLSQKQMVVKHRRFLTMPTKIKVRQDSQGLYLDPVSYKRYDGLANAIAAINVQHGLDLYLGFKPLFQQVYDEFNYPKEYQLDDIFIKAAASVIDAPINKGRIALIPHAVRYKYADKKLEGLNDVKKLMLRMGPENTQKIQTKLRQMVEALSAIQE